VGIKLADPARPEPPKQMGSVTLRYSFPGAMNGRSFVCPSGSKYTFDSASRNEQNVRNTDAQYMLAKWPELFQQLG
jgi:hypothetical protein